MICKHCQSPNCQPVYFHLCPSCLGEGCASCAGNLAPGVIPGQVEEGGNISVCTDYCDPVVDALVHDTKASLTDAVIYARNRVIADREGTNEKT